MRWHVMIGAKTFGPLEAESLGQMLQEGKLGLGAFVRDESGGQWMAIESSPFQGMVRKPKRSVVNIALKVILVLVLAYGVVVLSWMWWNTH